MSSHTAGGSSGALLGLMLLGAAVALAYQYLKPADDELRCPDEAVDVHIETDTSFTDYCEAAGQRHGPLRSWDPKHDQDLQREFYNRGRKCGSWKRGDYLGRLLYEGEYPPCPY